MADDTIDNSTTTDGKYKLQTVENVVTTTEYGNNRRQTKWCQITNNDQNQGSLSNQSNVGNNSNSNSSNNTTLVVVELYEDNSRIYDNSNSNNHSSQLTFKIKMDM